jgi:hypothetical protein
LAGHPASLTDNLESVADEAVAPQRLKFTLPHAREFTRDAHFEMAEVVAFRQGRLHQIT